MGRGVEIFSSSSAMALASKMPTQMGSERFSSSSLNMMMGILESGSSASPRTFISTNMRSPPVVQRGCHAGCEAAPR
jgi:hypothetical protein